MAVIAVMKRVKRHIVRRPEALRSCAARGKAIAPTLPATKRGRFVNESATTYRPRSFALKKSPIAA